MQVAWLPGGRCLATPCTPAPSVLPLTDMATSSYSSSSSESRESEASVSPVQLPPTPPPTSIAIFKSPRESKSSSSKTSHWSSSEESLPAAAFYGPLDAKNPLLVSCDKEIRELLGFIKKKKALATSEEQKHEFHRRCATTLFNIWTKYAPRLPPDYYNEKLLKVGDSLCQIKEYKLALLQCYRRYLQQFGDFDEHKEDVNQFKTVFFPKGFGDETAELTFHVLSSKNICSYKLVCDNDANLQNKESVSQCLHILSSLRLIMQVALPQEHLCWIIFNGTIYIYTICRKLMLIGLSAKALEYLLWASMCMESSAPLLSLRYLTWRATLYTAVCQCHYDCQTSIHGEAFARRALAKIDELRQLELMSSSKCQEESRRYYREATIKMAVMIFKRGVFESRRKNKAVFRPKIRINLKEAQSMVWPRTVTERLLDELFDCTASRFLAVLEALSDSSRRILQTGPLVTDEVELRDVVSELFMAGKELLILSNVGTNGKLDFPKTFFLEHMIERKNIISVCAAVKFTKLAFTYEEWGLFESLAGQLIQFLQKQDIPHLKRAEKDLILLLAVEPLINIKKNKGLIFPLDSDKEGQSVQVYLKHIARHESCVRSCGYSEDIFNLAAILHFCVCVPNKGVQPDKDIVVDIISFLWQKCKLGIQRINMSRSDFSKYSHKISTSKWIYLLWQISEVIHCYQMENLDIVMVAEITLRLSEILESLGSPRRKFRKSADMSAKKGPEEFPGTPKGIPEVLPILKRAPVEQLFYAYELLDKAIAGMNWNFMLTTLSDGSSTIDHCYAKYSQDMNGSTYTPISANSLMMDLHLELIHTQHRIAVVLLDQLQVLQMPTVSTNTKGWEKLKEPKSTQCFTELSVLNKIRKNKLVRASYLMQKALLLFEKNAACVNSQNLLMEAYALIEKLEAEQNALYSYQNYLENSKTKKSRIPPPPILLARTHCSVTLKPAPFISDVKVSWYCILGCKAEGSYGKVRLNNNRLPNSGEAIPADGKSIFEIKGLETNEKYIFAIAAYSSNGKLIGDAVGETTKPILIYPPLSAVTARMYLTQVAYQIGNYELAKKVFSPVWGYFVASPPQDDQSVVSLSNIMMVTQKRMQSNILADTSSILLYLFLRNIFVMSDIKIKEENLFCDNIKGNEIFPAQQMARLRECENVLVALELSNFLNDSNYALQAVTQCYGLLAPIIYHNIVLVPVIQILIKCIVVLQAIPNIVHSKKQVASFESIQHMIACCVFYMAKILRSWKEYDLAIAIINYGKKTLDITTACRSLFCNGQDDTGDEGTCYKKTSRSKKPQQVLLPEKINEQLNFLETHLLKLTKQYGSAELSGAEDPIFLYPVVLNWSMKGAMKEVMKFKQRPRFLEFFTQVMLKCMNDEKFQLMVEMVAPIYDFLKSVVIYFWNADTEDFTTFWNSKSDDSVSKIKTQLIYESESQLAVGINAREKDRALNWGLDHFMKVFSCCSRAMVLAYRGGYWTLLQNCCRAFWNFAQELQILLKQAVDTYKAFPINQDSFLCACVLPFSLGTELLIDMLIKLQSTNSVKPVEDKGDFSVPSCYGNIKSDNGGSSLIFEHPLDDINVVDLKWIHDYVLKSLEILYQVEKWETLVSLAIQFNTISHERYTEQVTPLLVYAQRQLLTRIQKFNGPDIAQQACARYEADNGQKITCRNFIGKQLMIDPSSPRTLPDAEGCSDLLKMLILSEHQRAKQLVCVPVDVEDTLRCFRETLEKSKYHNRSVRHTKKLLLLFLAQTQDVLQDSNQRSLKVQLLHSLGSLFVFAEKKRAAFKCWCQALDDIFRKPDALHTWKEFGTSIPSATNNSSPPVFKDYSEEFLSKLGIWGCLQGAVIAAKIAQFIKTANVKQRTNCCILSALLFQSLLRTTLLHPKAEHSYAQYEITQLLPGIELFTDQFRADICSVIASLYYVIRELHYAKYNLIVLPLLALYQYFVTVICQDIVRNLEARILKAEILIDLGFFSEASYEIFQIFHGKNLPSTIPAGYKTIAKVKTIQSFDSGKPLTNKDNIQVLEDLVNKGLPLILVTLGHQHLLNKYNFVKAHFFISLAATINCIPDSSSKTLFYTVAVDKNKPNTPNFKDLYPKDNENVHAQSLRLRDESTLCMMKSLLLTEAEEKINSLLSDMDLQCHKPLCQCSAQELEILVEARLQLAAIALQRQRAPYGAAIVYSTLKLLQDSKIFKKRMPEDLDSPTSPVNSTTENKDDSEFLDPISLNAREYFNIHLWLKCRLMLVTAFIAQIRGIGIMKENDMTDCLSLINEVCMEAKSADDMEILAELLMQAVILGLQEKHLKADIIGNLQEIINLLDGNEFLSPPSWLTLVRSLLLMDDLTKAEKFKDASSKDDKLIFLNQAHSILIAQMLTFGETIKFPLSDADFANPQQPLKNIYLPHVILLAKVKLRIGHTLSKQVYSQNKKKDITKWLPSLHIFEMALKLCKVAALEECEVEAEILFQKGRIERQMLKEDKSPISQVESFFEAIQLSLRNDQNPGLIRDSYLEIALMYFYLKKPKRKVSGTPSSLKPLGKRQSSIKEHASTRFEKFSLLAWIAIRAAAQVSEAVLTINLLIGKKNARTDKVSYMALPNIPEFAIVDLLSSYTDYLLENYQVSFQTGSPFLQQNDEIYDSVDPKRKANNKVDITWILLIRYFIHLQRINNMSKLLASATPVSGISLPDDMLLTSLYNSELILRQKEMHLFLKKFLQFYSSSCIDEFPKELIQGVEKSVSLEKFLFETSGKVHRENSLQSDISGKLFCSPSYTEAFSEMAVQAVNKELCFQWYIPPLDKPPKDTEPMVLLLYAYNLKPLKISDIKVPTANNLYVGTSWIPLNRQDIQKLDWTPALGTERVISIHEKLSNLAQIAELSLPSVPEIILEENVYETVEPEDKIVDTDIDNMILDCCSEIVALFSKDQDPTPLYEVPFDISLPAIFSLERLFDLANGCIVSVGSLFNWVVSIIP
ncbi:hypothetical protein H671_1g0667 [Cricetulus griseus]|nr:hypothetical protein H671_1g0667 [Cricetulus griseus]